MVTLNMGGVMQDLKSLVVKADKEVARWTKIGQSARELMAVIPGLIKENTVKRHYTPRRVGVMIKNRVIGVFRTGEVLTPRQVASRLGIKPTRVAKCICNNRALFDRVGPKQWKLK